MAKTGAIGADGDRRSAGQGGLVCVASVSPAAEIVAAAALFHQLPKRHHLLLRLMLLHLLLRLMLLQLLKLFMFCFCCEPSCSRANDPGRATFFRAQRRGRRAAAPPRGPKRSSAQWPARRDSEMRLQHCLTAVARHPRRVRTPATRSACTRRSQLSPAWRNCCLSSSSCCSSPPLRGRPIGAGHSATGMQTTRHRERLHQDPYDAADRR